MKHPGFIREFACSIMWLHVSKVNLYAKCRVMMVNGVERANV